MRFDFDTIWERRGKDAAAVEMIGSDTGWASRPDGPREGFTAIPMWVADMNFATAPCVVNAVIERAQHPLYGYFEPPKAYYDGIFNWHKTRNGVEGMTKEVISYANGVLGCVSAAIRAFTSPGDRILLHSPTYVGFTHVLEDTGRVAEHSPLVKDADGIWRMDYEDMERRLKKNNIHLAIFCSPHNPCGRVWEREEIERAMEIYRKYDVTVISDEIWSDIILFGNKHIPTQSISEDAKQRTIAVYAPSKTFNLAGLVGSYSVIYNKRLRFRVNRESELTHLNGMNVLSMHAMIGAYSEEGMAWTDELREVIGGNVTYACDFIAQNFPGVNVMRPQGTYMLFIDCRAYCERTGRSIGDVIKAGWDVGVTWQDGRAFFDPYSIRVNLALPRSLVEEAMRRLKEYVFI